jgi:hypothetical protein
MLGETFIYNNMLHSNMMKGSKNNEVFGEK